VISTAMVPQELLGASVVAVPEADADELNQAPCVPGEDASSAVYPLGVLIVTLAATPAKNSSPSLALAPVSAPPEAVAEEPELTAERATGLAVLLPESCTTSITVRVLFDALKFTPMVPFAVPVPAAR
jgi:hypothetical protein